MTPEEIKRAANQLAFMWFEYSDALFNVKREHKEAAARHLSYWITAWTMGGNGYIHDEFKKAFAKMLDMEAPNPANVTEIIAFTLISVLDSMGQEGETPVRPT